MTSHFVWFGRSAALVPPKDLLGVACVEVPPVNTFPDDEDQCKLHTAIA